MYLEVLNFKDTQSHELSHRFYTSTEQGLATCALGRMPTNILLEAFPLAGDQK